MKLMRKNKHELITKKLFAMTDNCHFGAYVLLASSPLWTTVKVTHFGRGFSKPLVNWYGKRAIAELYKMSQLR